MHRNEDSVIFVLISRTNFSRNLVRVLCSLIVVARFSQRSLDSTWAFAIEELHTVLKRPFR